MEKELMKHISKDVTNYVVLEYLNAKDYKEAFKDVLKDIKTIGEAIDNDTYCFALCFEYGDDELKTRFLFDSFILLRHKYFLL